MLDQNTDRMWYVIGAVIIGAAIILIMNKTFPQLFASVGETFTVKTAYVSNVVKDIGYSADNESPGDGGQMTDGVAPLTRESMGLSMDDVEISNGTHVAYVDDVWTVSVNAPTHNVNWWSSGFRFKKGNVVVPYGKTLSISYEIFIPKGVTGTYSSDDINSHPHDTAVLSWNQNDNDEVSKRTFTGRGGGVHGRYNVPLKDGQWNTVTFKTSNTDSRNTEKVALYNISNFGVYNNTGKPLEVQLRNVKGELLTY